jgi:hypothetical protein
MTANPPIRRRAVLRYGVTALAAAAAAACSGTAAAQQ